MKFAIAELRFAVLMKTKTIKKETVIALFNSNKDAIAFKKFCDKEYSHIRFRVMEFDN